MTQCCAELRQTIFSVPECGDERCVTFGGTMSSDSGLNHAYEVVLGLAAIRTIWGVWPEDRGELADALRTELLAGPNADKHFQFDSTIAPCRPGIAPNGQVYTATPLSFAGYTAIHRHLTEAEMHRLRGEGAAPVASGGVFVIDILPAESAFGRPGPRLA
jgi:hypothetical protein